MSIPEICFIKIKQMKTINNLPKNLNKHLLKYYVSKNESFDSSNFEEKELILVEAQSKIYNAEFYIYSLLSISAITFLLRLLILKTL